MTPDPWCKAERHGSSLYAYVSDRCRCASARLASAAYAKKRRQAAKAGTPLLVDGTGTGRRIHALMAAGWSSPALASRLYIHKNRIAKLANQPRIHSAWARTIADVYDQIGLEEGPSNRARAAAVRAGWPPPIEWGDDIDDPAAKPLDLDHIYRPGHPRAAVPIEDIEMLIATGGTWETAAARAGTSRLALERRLHRCERRDLVARLSRNSEQWTDPAHNNRWTA